MPTMIKRLLVISGFVFGFIFIYKIAMFTLSRNAVTPEMFLDIGNTMGSINQVIQLFSLGVEGVNIIKEHRAISIVEEKFNTIYDWMTGSPE